MLTPQLIHLDSIRSQEKLQGWFHFVVHERHLPRLIAPQLATFTKMKRQYGLEPPVAKGSSGRSDVGKTKRSSVEVGGVVQQVVNKHWLRWCAYV